jgi:hypothetical protein
LAAVGLADAVREDGGGDQGADLPHGHGADGPPDDGGGCGGQGQGPLRAAVLVGTLGRAL